MILNVTVIGVELVVLASLALILHARSRRYGLAPLLVYLAGLVAMLHALSPIQVRVDLVVTTLVISSVTLVPVILMTILVLYVVEGTASARLAILSVVALSILVLTFQAGLDAHMNLPGGGNTAGLPADSSVFNKPWSFTLSSILAFAGSLLTVVVVYQTLTNRVPRIPLWLSPAIALLAALVMDEVLFKTVIFGWQALADWTWGGLAGKVSAGLLLSPGMAFYMSRAAPRLEGYSGTRERKAFEVIFGSYRTQEVALRETAKKRRRAELALEASETRFRTTFEEAGVGLVHSQAEGKLLRANRAVCQMLGYSEAELKELNWKDITHPDDLPGNVGEVQELLDGKRDRMVTDKRYIRKDGTAVWAHATVSVVRDEGGTSPYFVVAIEDLTDRRATEQRLRQAQKMEAVGQLTGGVAHDFNNLLTVIMGGVELGMDDQVDETEKKKVLEDALTAAKRGASLTQRLLAFSRKQSLKPVSLHAERVLSEMRDLLVRTLGETIRVRLESAPDLGKCSADQTQLENAILNLSLNALEVDVATLTLPPLNETDERCRGWW